MTDHEFTTEELENEVWFPVRDFPNYEVSNLAQTHKIVNYQTWKHVE